MRAFLVFLLVAGASARPEAPYIYRQPQVQVAATNGAASASVPQAAPATIQQFPSNSYGTPLSFQVTGPASSGPAFIPSPNFYQGFQGFPQGYPTFHSLGAQGLSVQGLSSQGLGSQGLSSQGFGSQSLGSQGFGSQSLGSQGFGSQSLGSQGFGSQGFGSQGFGSQGLNSQGFSSQGLTAQGYPSFQDLNSQNFQTLQGTGQIAVAPTLAAAVDNKIELSASSDSGSGQFQQSFTTASQAPSPTPTAQASVAPPPAPKSPPPPPPSPPSPVIQKHIYVHVPPPEPIEEQTRFANVVAPRTNYKIIFIKAPSPPSISQSIYQQQAQSQEKTIVYVLVKKPDEQEDVVFKNIQDQKPSKPEVYFIKYRAKSEENQQGSGQNAVIAQDDITIKSEGNSQGVTLGSESSSNSDSFTNDISQTTFGATSNTVSSGASQAVVGTYGAPPLQIYQ